MGRNILLAFAGPGKVSKNNIKDLLADYLDIGEEDSKGLPIYPDDVDEIRAVIPAAEGYLTRTVEMLWEWADDYAEFPYEAIYDHETRDNEEILERAEQVVQARNVSLALVDRLVEGQKNGDQVALIVAYGEDGDDRTEMLVDLAQGKDVKVLDITAGLDEVVFSDRTSEPEPEEERPRRRRTAQAEPEEPAEEPRPRRGKPRKTAETSPAPAEAAEPESVEQEVAHARQTAQKAAEAVPVPEGSDIVLQALTQALSLVHTLDFAHAAMTLRKEAVPCALNLLLKEAIQQYTGGEPAKEPEPDEEEAPAKTAGRPRKDGTPAKPRTPAQRGVKEWLNSDGEWVRAGRGRLPRNVRTRMVDPKTGDVLSED